MNTTDKPDGALQKLMDVSGIKGIGWPVKKKLGNELAIVAATYASDHRCYPRKAA